MITKLETLQDLIQEHKNMALERFEEGSETPFIIGYSGTKRLVFPLFYRDEEEKEKILNIVTLGFIALDVKRYTFDAQGYSLSYSKETDYITEYNKLKASGKSIKDHPDHIEVFMCGAVSYTQKIMQTFQIKEKTLIDLGEEKEAEGRFTELLPPNEIDPKLKKEIKEHFNKLLELLPIKIGPI